MPITHSRRPPGRRDKRRRPEGHALAPSQKTGKRAARAAAPTAQSAVDYLRTQGKTNMADAVETVLEYALTFAGTSQQPSQTLSLHLDRRFRDQVKEQAEAEGVAITAAVLDGFAEFLDGSWEPPKPERRPVGIPVEKVSMSVRVPSNVVEQVEAKAEALVLQRGWELSRGSELNARQVAASALARRFGVEQERPSRGWDANYKLLMDVPEPFRDFVRAAVKAGGPNPSIVLRDAFARFLDGSWIPAEPPPRAPRGVGVEKVRMTVQVNDVVRDQVERLGADPERVAERGYQLIPAQVALAAIVDAYDVPESLLYPWLEAEPAE